jgi:hypothetical protein
MSVFAMLPVAFSLALAPLEEGQRNGQPIVFGTRSALTQANSLYGPTGLLTIPTAYTAEHEQFVFGAGFARELSAPSINYGIAPYVEVGGTFLQRTNARNRAIGNAKITLIPQNFGNFEVGVGVIDAVDAVNQTVYVVGSMDLTPPNWDPTGRTGNPIAFKAHLGAGTGLFQDRLFGGAEMLFPNQISLLGEYDSENFNVGLRYVHDDRFRLQLGLHDKGLIFGASTLFRF